MRTTGIIRRIDNLGRIVIPKEIRRSLKIRDGEMLEIFIDSDKILLNKFSPMNDFVNVAEKYVDTINDNFERNIIVTDRDKVIAASDNLKKKYISEDISDFLLKYIERREIFIEKFKKDLYITNFEKEECTYIISPIIANSECAGLVIVLSMEKDINDLDQKICLITSQFLGKHIEG